MFIVHDHILGSNRIAIGTLARYVRFGYYIGGHRERGRGRNVDGSGRHFYGLEYRIYPRHCWHVSIGIVTLSVIHRNIGLFRPSGRVLFETKTKRR